MITAHASLMGRQHARMPSHHLGQFGLVGVSSILQSYL